MLPIALDRWRSLPDMAIMLPACSFLLRYTVLGSSMMSLMSPKALTDKSQAGRQLMLGHKLVAQLFWRSCL